MENFAFQYHPYEELSVRLVGDGEVQLETPWTSVRVAFDPEIADQIQGVCASVAQGLTDAQVDDFLSAFDEHFVAYTSPRSLVREPSHASRLKTLTAPLKDSGPDSWLKALLPSVGYLVSLENHHWRWDASKILRKSHHVASDSYDPQAAYRALMCEVLRAVSSESRGLNRLLQFLRVQLSESEEAFFEGTRHYLRQYHHITSTSSDCLMPALYSMPYAKKSVMKLVHEEFGHGSFTRDSLKELGVKDPLDLPLSPHVAALMDLLRTAAHSNPLAFALLFSVFELSGEQESDPVAELLLQTSKPAAAKGLQRHFQLNKDGAHFMTGLPLIAEMRGLDADTVFESARMGELLLMLFDGLHEDVENYARRQRS